MKLPRLEVLLFSVGGARYGIDLGRVAGVIRDLPDGILELGTERVTVLFEGSPVPVFPAASFLAESPPRTLTPREAIVLDDGSGPCGLAVDTTDGVVEVTAGSELYAFPPRFAGEWGVCRPWGLLTVSGSPVILLDLQPATVH